MWFCLHDVRIHIRRAILSVFLSGLLENCSQLNCQVLLLNMMQGLNKSISGRELTPLYISICTSFIICILKLEQTVKVIRFAHSMCSYLRGMADFMNTLPESNDEQSPHGRLQTVHGSVRNIFD